MYVTRYIITIIMQVTTQDLKWKILSHRSLMTFSRNLHLRYQSMQEIEMPRKCCFYPLEEELGRGALIKQKFNYLLSIRNFGRGKVHRPGQRAAGETHHDYFCAKTYFKGP